MTQFARDTAASGSRGPAAGKSAGRITFGYQRTVQRVRRYGRHPLSCWHGTSNRLPVKLSVGDRRPPRRAQRWALLKSHTSPRRSCSWEARCRRAVVVEVRERRERAWEDGREKRWLVANPLSQSNKSSLSLLFTKPPPKKEGSR